MGLLFGGRVQPDERKISYQDYWGKDMLPESWQRDPKVLDLWGMPAAKRCIRLLTAYFTQLPFHAYTSSASGLVRMPVQPEIVRRPDPRITRANWLQQHAFAQLTDGNSFGFVAGTDAAGYPNTIVWLPPWEVVVDSNSPTDTFRYSRNGYTFAPGEIWHLRYMTVPGRPRGLGPLESDGLFDLHAKIQKFAREWFENGGVPASVLSHEKPVTPEQSDQVRKSWRNALKLGGRNVAVLGGGWQFNKIGLTGDEAQMLEAGQEIARDVCGAYGIDPARFGIPTSGSSITYSNREQRMQDEITTTINAPIVDFQESFSDLLPPNVSVKFNTAGLLRSDSKTRFELYKLAAEIENLTGRSPLTVDEMRQLEDSAPLEDTGTTNVRQLAEIAQKLYLGIGKAYTTDEAREILNRAGAGLDIPGPANYPIGVVNAPPSESRPQ